MNEVRAQKLRPAVSEAPPSQIRLQVSRLSQELWALAVIQLLPVLPLLVAEQKRAPAHHGELPPSGKRGAAPHLAPLGLHWL